MAYNVKIVNKASEVEIGGSNEGFLLSLSRLVRLLFNIEQ